MQSEVTPKKLAVLFHIVDFGKGGTETALIGWLRALPPEQFTLGLSIAYPTPEFDEVYRSQLPPGVAIHVLHEAPILHTLHTLRREGKLGKLGRLARTLFSSTVNKYWSARRMAQIAPQYDVVVDFDLSLRHVSGRFSRPWIGVSHFSFAARLTGRPKKIARLAKQYGRYDGIGVLNTAMANEAEAIFGNMIKRVLMLPNAIDINEIKRRASLPLTPSPAFREKLQGAPYIVSVARLDEAQKDHATLIAAYVAAVQNHGVKEHLVLVGDGPDRAKVEAMVRDSGLAHQIHVVGYLSNPHPVIAKAALLVLSTRYEGLPMVLLEALALERPVICSDCPTGPRDMLDNGQAGVLVPCGDVSALTQAFVNVLNDPEMRRKLAEVAPQRAAYFGAQASASRLAAYCRELLA